MDNGAAREVDCLFPAHLRKCVEFYKMLILFGIKSSFVGSSTGFAGVFVGYLRRSAPLCQRCGGEPWPDRGFFMVLATRNHIAAIAAQNANTACVPISSMSQPPVNPPAKAPRNCEVE
uniref:Uncharacterized protein n=1 Tax=Candidatus Kentrum sp. LFY TaxID=2126342 RepID=A0A450WXU3_9GAMM|nr:MAG: hypothetical protein BECKLFY1418C_GA0070996_11049 [Candidatus Kentron sp. LFY]